MRGLFLSFNALVLLLSCVALMSLFTGGSGADLPVLLIALMLASVLLLVAVPIRCLQLRHAANPDGWLQLLKRQTPNWLKFAASLSLALLFCGMLALQLTAALSDEGVRLYQYLPVFSGTLAVLGYLLGNLSPKT